MRTNGRRNQGVAETSAAARSQRRARIALFILCGSLLPRLAPALADSPAEGASGSFTSVLLIAIGVLALGALLITAIMKWGSKQDHMNEMVSFCMRFLIDSSRASEGREAATALGQARDPRAILVLVDVVNDQQADQTVRKAAADALSAMTTDYRKYRPVIAELKSASERQDHSRLIELLTLNFEKSGDGHVQSAYLIGRAYMSQGHYADAKEWFRVAEARNNVTPFYGNQIGRLIIECNRRLFAIGDELFKSGEYHQARERYAAVSHGLSNEENLRYFGFLRLACAYCKLGDYDATDQAILLASKNGQETDLSLALKKLLQKVLDRDHPSSSQQRQRVIGEIDKLATEIMEKLCQQVTDET